MSLCMTNFHPALSGLFESWMTHWKSTGYDLHVQTERKDLWSQFCNELHYFPTCYSHDSIVYQLEYQRGHGGDWLDVSSILSYSNQKIAAIPISFSCRDNLFSFSSQGLPVFPPLFHPSCPEKVRKKCVKDYWEFLANLAFPIDEINCEELLVESSRLSDWHMEAMFRGAQANLSHELYLDLRPSLEEIRTCFRRRFRSMINQAKKLWKYEMWSGSCCSRENWEEFRLLHLDVAGRATRSLKSWEIQFETVKSGRAFVIALRNPEGGSLIGAALFDCTTTEGSYSVGAYDRSLFDKPVSHLAHALAVEEMKRRGLKWYRIGSRPFEQDIPSPTSKEITIGDFKQGFASHVFPKIRFFMKRQFADGGSI